MRIFLLFPPNHVRVLFPEGPNNFIGIIPNLVINGGVNNPALNGGNRRRKRSVDPADDMAVHQRYAYNPDTSDRTQTWTWPTASGITEAEANQICKDTIINSNAHHFCHDKFGDVIYSVGSCVADILVREKSILTVSHTHKQKHSAPFEFNKTSFFQKPSKFH